MPICSPADAHRGDISMKSAIPVLISLTTLATVLEADDTVNFSREVLPILSNKCFVCHGPDAAEYGEDMRRLDSAEGAMAATDSGRAIDPQAPAKSLLLLRIHSEDDPMPPADAEKQLTRAERSILTRWVEQGGNYSKHWAFVKPRKINRPEKDTVAVVDGLIAERQKAAGTSFSPEADRATLARRVALVLTGLTPKQDVLQQFLQDRSPHAYSRLVEQLLSDPGFGEHQARYWLDAVRYGDTHGLHLDNRRGIYPYRDWVVRAFNNNLPINTFLTWQLAGDLLPNASMDQRIATGFVRMNPSTAEGGAIPAEFQAKNNFDRTETLGTVLLGMSLTCARCHTHKYDPIPQTEYYRLLAFFNSTAESSMDGNKYEYGPTLKVPRDQAEWQQWRNLQRQRDQLVNDIPPAGGLSPDEEKKYGSVSSDERLKLLANTKAGLANSDVQQEAQQLVATMEQVRKGFTSTLVAQDLPKPRETRVLRRGEYNLPTGDPLQPGIISVMGQFPAETPRNRLGLARWLTSSDHPLVSRVLVNRIWQRVFGDGLVRTPEDFGLQGQHPTHPELLDWLAVDFQESGWDLKQLLRTLVHTKTFRQSSTWRTDIEDPENRLFARAASYRLDAEVLRDLGLWSSGLLNPHMGGEGVKPYQPAGMWLAMAHPASNTKSYQRDKGDRLYRRSLYVYWKRTSPHPMMTLFDAPDRESSCVRRSRTNTSLQSLGLLNETQRTEMSRKLAERLIRESPDDDARIDYAYRMLASRDASAKEQAVCHRLLQQMKARYAAAPKEAEQLLGIGEVARDKSLDPVEVAAWSQVATIMLASDAAIMLY